MSKDKYHHGTLKQDMIEKGLELLNEQGIEGFSLRKVASMCGVSHTAPYKHFKGKEELIAAISQAVSAAFRDSMIESIELYPNDPKLQIIEMGKSYVKFMVENPEYMKFLFLSKHNEPIVVGNNGLVHIEGTAFDIFKKSSEYYLSSINSDEKLNYVKTLSMWSLVHGIAMLIINNVVKYEGDYLELVEHMLRESFKE